MIINFSKLYCLGSDFVVIDGVTQKCFISSNKIKQLSDRYHGIGFDYLIIIEPPYDPDVDFHCRIFDSEGKEHSSFLAAISCLANYATRKCLINRKNIYVSFKNGNKVVEINNDNSTIIDLGKPVFTPNNIPFKAQKQEKFYFISNNNINFLCGCVAIKKPICVVNHNDIINLDINDVVSSVLNNERFPKGVILVVMNVISNSEITINVFDNKKDESSYELAASGAVAIGKMQGILESIVQVNLLKTKLSVNLKTDIIKVLSFIEFIFDGAIII